MTRLHDYFRSSASYRVRIALNLKGIAYDGVAWNLRDGAQRSADYARISPQPLVPTLEIDDLLLTQSLSIVEYLDERQPDPPLLPADPAGRALARALALTIACDIHPLNNLRVLGYLTDPLGQDEVTRNAWYAHWVTEGFTAFEEQLRRSGRNGRFCIGDTPGLADLCLIPQLYNARRFEVPLDAFPTILEIAARAEHHPAFAAAHPDN
jgi:maleylacetoacetate isomerase